MDIKKKNIHGLVSSYEKHRVGTHIDKRKRDIGKSKRDIESLLLKKSFIFLASCKSVYLFHWKGQKGFLCEYKYTKNPMHFSISCISGTKV